MEEESLAAYVPNRPNFHRISPILTNLALGPLQGKCTIPHSLFYMEKTHPPDQAVQGAPSTLPSSSSSHVVYLNVGGQKFVTRLQTLLSRGPNFLSALVENDLSGRISTPKDKEGYLVLDRSPQLFALVLGSSSLCPHRSLSYSLARSCP